MSYSAVATAILLLSSTILIVILVFRYKEALRVLMTSVLLVGILLGGPPLLLWLYAEDWRMSEVAQGWPTTEGRITSSSVDYCLLCDDPRYHVRISYEYLVDGQAHTGKRLQFGSDSFDRDPEAIMRNYVGDAKVPVYFDPANPGKAVLQRRFAVASSDLLLTGVIAGGGIAFDAWLLFEAAKRLPSVILRLRRRMLNGLADSLS